MSFICLNRACCDWSRSHGICLVFEPDICLQLNKPDSCYSRDSFMPIFRLFLGQCIVNLCHNSSFKVNNDNFSWVRAVNQNAGELNIHAALSGTGKIENPPV